MAEDLRVQFCKILERLWRINMTDNYYIADSVDNNQLSNTVDGVPIRKLFIGNIAQRTTHQDLEILFSAYGELDSCFLKRCTGKSNYAFVTFRTTTAALQASKDGSKKKIHLHNRDLRVMPADSWHQPDSIENQNKKIHKTENINKISTDYILNDDAEIHKLNDDCLMHIFVFLPITDRVRIERVCRLWRNLSQESWRKFKRLDLTQATWGFNITNTGPKEINTATLRKVLLRCGQFLTHIDFSTYSGNLSKSTLTVVGRLCPNLQYIDVTGLNVSPAGIKALANSCTNITEFSLGHCSSTCDSDLSQLFARNKKLRYLKLLQNSITGKCLLNLPSDSMETIVLRECSSVSPCHIYNALQNFANLHTLSLDMCVSFNDQVIRGISSRSKSLKVLNLCNYYPMMTVVAMYQLSELVNLVTLNVSENVLAKDDFLIAIGTHCKQLTSVDISSCHEVTNKGLQSVVSLPKLQHLYINYLGKITDEVLVNIPNLRSMQCRGCPSLQNNCLSILIEESQNIELLDFSGCDHISNELIDVAIEATKNRTNNLVLKMYVGNTDVYTSQIVKVSPFLQVLNVDLSEAHLRPDFHHGHYLDGYLDLSDYEYDERDFDFSDSYDSDADEVVFF